MSFEIKANEKLFDEWVHQAQRVRSFAGIVQNDMILSDEFLKEYHDNFKKCMKELNDLYYNTIGYIKNEEVE